MKNKNDKTVFCVSSVYSAAAANCFLSFFVTDSWLIFLV